MAEQVDSVVEKGVEELEKEITCAICHEHYNDPKVLPCSHYYCKQCIHLLTLRTGIDKPFSCPECRQDTTLPQGGVDHLQTAFFINRMKEVHSKLERAHGKVEAKCEQCSVGKAEAFCRQCTEFICAECVLLHLKLKIYIGHKTISLDELKKGGAKEIISQESPLQICQEHDEPMKIYCFDCSCLICRDCTISDHNGHNHKFIKKSAPETKEKLIQQLGSLKEVKVSLSRAVEEIQTTKSEMEAQVDSTTIKVEESFEAFYKIIEEHKQKLLNEAVIRAILKLERLSQQKESLSTECSVIQSVIEYTEQCLKHSTDDEIMCMHGDIQSRIDREMKERSLEPVEEVDVGVEVSCAEDLRQLCQTKMKVIQLPLDPTKCVATVEEVKTAQVNKPVTTSLNLVKKISNGIRTRQKCAVECQLKSLANRSIVKCNVDLIKGHEYRIRYTPTIRGRHELVVTVNGQEVAGSPFPVFVSIQLGKVVRILPGMKTPTGVAMNSAQELIVTDQSHGVVVMDRNGRKKISNTYNIGNPNGVAVDNAGNIYITDSKNHKISKLNKEMDLLHVLETESDPRGVTVVGDEVMVCYNNSIRIYNKNLKYVREIAGEFNDLVDISADEHGNLYVCDKGSSHIQVLGNGGEYLRSFLHANAGVPCGIFVAMEMVYVTISSKNNWGQLSPFAILVYNMEADCVHTFNMSKINTMSYQRLGENTYKYGVCVDEDGFLYVCDAGKVTVY